MKVTFVCDSGANIHSKREEEMDTVEDLGLAEGEWEKLTDDQKQEHVNEWAWDRLEIFWREDDGDDS